VPPEGFTAQAAGEGADLASGDPEVHASLRLRACATERSARAFAEDTLLRILLTATAKDTVRTVLEHSEGTTPDKRQPRSYVRCEVTGSGKARIEEYHFVAGRERCYAMWFEAPKDAWERLLPARRALLAGLAIDEPAPDAAAPEKLTGTEGRFEVALPSGWKSETEEGGDLRLLRHSGSGAVVLRSIPRPDAVRTADAMAEDLATLVTRQETSLGARVEVLARNRALGGGAKIATSSVMMRFTRKSGAVQRQEVHAFTGARTVTLVLMDAPETLWALWLPSFRQVWSSLRIHDDPLPGADAPATKPKGTPAPKPEARPPATPKPPTPPEPPPGSEFSPLDAYADPAGLFTMPVPTGWKVEGTPMGVNATSPRGNALVSLTLGVRDGDDHDAFVTRVVGRMPTSFPGWKERSRAVGGGDDVRVTRIEATTGVDGTPVLMLADLLTSPRFHQLLLLVCPLAEREAYARLFDDVLDRAGSVTGAWPAERPLTRLRAVAAERAPYVLEVPTNWRVEPDGLDLVVTSPHGDALVVARVADRTHESLDAFAQAVLARMKGRGRSVEVLSQEVREEEGRSVLIARLRDEVGGVPWERELRAVQTPTHELQIVLACRVDLRFKWDAILGRIAGSWKTR
jgi:hypothetical protein